MIAGPGVFICNECILLAVEILEKDVEGYEDRRLSVEIHSDLCTIEMLNYEAFTNLGAYTKGVMHALQTKLPEKNGQDDTK